MRNSSSSSTTALIYPVLPPHCDFIADEMVMIKYQGWSQHFGARNYYDYEYGVRIYWFQLWWRCGSAKSVGDGVPRPRTKGIVCTYSRKRQSKKEFWGFLNDFNHSLGPICVYCCSARRIGRLGHFLSAVVPLDLLEGCIDSLTTLQEIVSDE